MRDGTGRNERVVGSRGWFTARRTQRGSDAPKCPRTFGVERKDFEIPPPPAADVADVRCVRRQIGRHAAPRTARRVIALTQTRLATRRDPPARPSRITVDVSSMPLDRSADPFTVTDPPRCPRPNATYPRPRVAGFGAGESVRWDSTLGRGSGLSSATAAPSRVTTIRSPRSTLRSTSPPWLRRSRMVTTAVICIGITGETYPHGRCISGRKLAA